MGPLISISMPRDEPGSGSLLTRATDAGNDAL